MIARTVLVGLFISANAVCFSQKAGLDRSAFYEAMASDNIELVNSQQEIARSSGNDGFEGALLMKKAGLVQKANAKLSLFKSGHRLLDNAIKKDESNAELRFLRLMIQEHAPKVLNYKSDLTNDSLLIKQRFSQLDSETQKAILRYSKTSKVLKPTDFNGT